MKTWAWTLWAVTPVFALAFHFGPGQGLLKRDLAFDELAATRSLETDAMRLQEIAYEAQLKTLAARQKLAETDTESNRQTVDELAVAEQKAYAEASDAWKATAERYQQVETMLGEDKEANQVRLMRGRALVRAGEVFNGIEALEQTLNAVLESSSSTPSESKKQNSELIKAAREELAAAHYYGARLLREEGRSADVWKQVSETSRQQFKFLAEEQLQSASSSEASSFQRNLERVLDLEQQDRSELVGRPMPKDSPRARRPGDGEPKQGRPGVGPPRGDRPGNGASGMMQIGDGW